MLSNKDINFNDATQTLTINGERHAVGKAIAERVSALEDGKLDNILSADSETALSVGDSFQIPAAMLERDIVIICFNRAAWCASISVFTNLIKRGDAATGLKIVTGDKTNPTVDKYIIFDISASGLLTIDYINNWSAPYVKVRAL